VIVQKVTNLKYPPIIAHFEIRDFTCDPSFITHAIGYEPTSTWREGDSMLKGEGRRPYTAWRLTAPELGIEAEEYAQWLLAHLPMDLDLSSTTKEWQAQFAFVINVTDVAPAVFLQAETLQRIARLKAHLDVDIYTADAEDDLPNEP
jgi:hypothetical protein